jgi:hypothetical protein
MRSAIFLLRDRAGRIHIIEGELGINAALTVCNAEPATFAPGRVPAVLADPAILTVVVTNDADSVVSLENSRYMPVDTRTIGVKVFINGQSGDYRTLCGNYVFAVGNCKFCVQALILAYGAKPDLQG